MPSLTRTVITVETTPQLLRRGRMVIHEALLDGDEHMSIGDRVLLYDGEYTYRSAQVTAHDGDLWTLTLARPDS